MFIRLPIRQKGRGGYYTADALINPDNISGIFSDNEHATIRLAGSSDYYACDMKVEDLLKIVAPHEIAKNVFGTAEDRQIAEQADLGTAIQYAGRLTAVSAGIEIMKEIEKAAESIVFDTFYEDTASKARKKLQAQITQIVAAAIAVSPTTVRSTDQG